MARNKLFHFIVRDIQHPESAVCGYPLIGRFFDAAQHAGAQPQEQTDQQRNHCADQCDQYHGIQQYVQLDGWHGAGPVLHGGGLVEQQAEVHQDVARAEGGEYPQRTMVLVKPLFDADAAV